MINQAAEEFNIDLENSYMIGDRESDIMAGVNAGTKTILVQTGNEPVISKEASYTAPDLLAAINYIAAQS
jgi:D-glycero-D-manno-heptose 1,7-bisphosphate phosphatase